VETALIQLWSSSTSLGRDFVLDIATRHDGENEAPQAWMEEHPTLPSQRALMVTLPPKVLGQAGHRGTAADGKGEVIFLADQSGSMSDKIRSLKSAMQFFLKGILLGTKFNIWSLGSRYRSWCSRSVDYDEASLDAALAYVVKTFDADLGGTELFPAIQAVVAARDKARMTNVIVLTDGQTWRLDATLVFIQQTRVRNKGRVRFFSLSIGDGVLHARVEGIAKAGGSYAEVIPSSVRDGVGGPRCLDAAGLPLDRPPQPAALELSVSRSQPGTGTSVKLLSPESSQRSPRSPRPFTSSRRARSSTASSAARATCTSASPARTAASGPRPHLSSARQRRSPASGDWCPSGRASSSGRSSMSPGMATAALTRSLTEPWSTLRPGR